MQEPTEPEVAGKDKKHRGGNQEGALTQALRYGRWVE
jgi:hypothetical protein